MPGAVQGLGSHRAEASPGLWILESISSWDGGVVLVALHVDARSKPGLVVDRAPHTHAHTGHS